MRTAPFHPWDSDEDQAKQIQRRLSKLVALHDGFTSVGLVGGVSIRPIDLTTVRAAICILDVPSMKTVDSATATAKPHFRYMSGLRAFQAGPAVIAAFEKLHARTDFVIWDGHGIAHPRRCGLASHPGVLLNIPSVGVSEELLYGECKLDTFAEERGSRVPVVDPKTSLRSVPPFARATMSVLFSSAWAIASRSNQPYELFSNAHLATDSRNLYAQRECCVNSFTNSIPDAAEPALLRPPAIRRLEIRPETPVSGRISSGSKLVMRPLASRMKPCSMPLESK